MISEKTFIKYYSSFWEQLLPGVENYVRMINSGLKERFVTPIVIEDLPTRRALINGMSYRLFFRLQMGEIDLKEVKAILANSQTVIDLQRSVASKMSHLDRSLDFESSLSEDELRIVLELTLRLQNYFRSKLNVTIYPRFKGCGLLFDCSGDALYRGTLVEIKAGNASFGKHDIYQLFTYAALNYASDDFSISNFELLNVRTGLIWNERVENVSEIIAGTSSAEIYSEIIRYVSNNFRSI